MIKLSQEQKLLIGNRTATDSGAFAAAYSFWLLLGLFGAHRFYLHYDKSALLQLLGSALGFALAAGGIAWGGTPLDGLFFDQSINDILRSSETWSGTVLFYGGAALLSIMALWWLSDSIFIYKTIAHKRSAAVRDVIAFYQAY